MFVFSLVSLLFSQLLGQEGTRQDWNDQAIPLLAVYPDKTIIEKDTCTLMFVAALFTIARTWKQPRCPSTDERIKKLWYIHTMEYYSAIKRNKIGSFVVMWMDLESIIWNAVSQKEKNKHCILRHIYVIYYRKIVLTNLFEGQE